MEPFRSSIEQLQEGLKLRRESVREMGSALEFIDKFMKCSGTIVGNEMHTLS